MLINTYLSKLIQKLFINIESHIASIIIAKIIQYICDNLISRRNRKSKLRKIFFQLKQKQITTILSKKYIEQNNLYMLLLQIKLLYILIAINKKILIVQYNIDNFALLQKIYFDNNNNNNNIIAATIEIV